MELDEGLTCGSLRSILLFHGKGNDFKSDNSFVRTYIFAYSSEFQIRSPRLCRLVSGVLILTVYVLLWVRAVFKIR